MQAVTISADDLSTTAKNAVWLRVNPSGLNRVDKIKMLSAALITECEAVADEFPSVENEAQVAINYVRTASMWAVAVASTGL